MARARRDGTIGNDGRFVRGTIGSVWWLAHERLTLIGVASWRVRRRHVKRARVHAALAVFVLEPTPAPWLGAVQSATAADEAADRRADDEAIAVDPWRASMGKRCRLRRSARALRRRDTVRSGRGGDRRAAQRGITG